jgi:molybdopterin molybdotransferase
MIMNTIYQNDGLVELGEEITLVQHGQTVGFLGYASLM